MKSNIFFWGGGGGGFRKMNIFGGMKILWIFLGVINFKYFFGVHEIPDIFFR